MPVAGLVAHLTGSNKVKDLTKTLLHGHDRVTVGPCDGVRVALVTETERAEDDAALFEEIAAMEGVGLLQVVFHDFSDIGGVEGTVPRRWKAGR